MKLYFSPTDNNIIMCMQQSLLVSYIGVDTKITRAPSISCVNTNNLWYNSFKKNLLQETKVLGRK